LRMRRRFFSEGFSYSLALPSVLTFFLISVNEGGAF
jgi:hypothetical protein